MSDFQSVTFFSILAAITAWWGLLSEVLLLKWMSPLGGMKPSNVWNYVKQILLTILKFSKYWIVTIIPKFGHTSNMILC
jgi:hypothetical protein